MDLMEMILSSVLLSLIAPTMNNDMISLIFHKATIYDLGLCSKSELFSRKEF